MFTALNIEPESDSEDDIDNSKEIQIEEALKLYQNALKLHSLGPRFYAEAEEAYEALFRSEVFTYIESFSESQRVEYYSEAPDDVVISHERAVAESVTAAANTDGAPSTLPQILYLSYKNHGHFLLDRLKWRLQNPAGESTSPAPAANQSDWTTEHVTASLQHLVEAADRDDTDAELWRQLSRICESLGSKRVARFCLEAVLDRDDATGNAWPEPLGLQELFAVERLRCILQDLEDDLSESNLPTLTRQQQGIVQSFNSQIDPLPYLPTRSPEVRDRTATDQKIHGLANSQVIVAPLRTWTSCGKAILLQLQQENQCFVGSQAGTCYTLLLPSSYQPINPNPPTTQPVEFAKDVHASTVSTVASSTKKSPVKVLHIPDADASHDVQASPQGIKTTLSRLPAASELVEVSKEVTRSEQATVLGRPKIESEQAKHTRVSNVNPQVNQSHTITLPTRKRSNEVTEVEDAEDNTRSRSKRIKARVSVDEPASGREARARQQLELYQQGELQYFNILDERAFGQLAEPLSVLGVATTTIVREQRATIVSLVKALKDSNVETAGLLVRDEQTLWKDLTALIFKWDNGLSQVFLHGGGSEDPMSSVGVAQKSGILVFLEQSGMQACEHSPKPSLADDRGLEAFAKDARNREVQIDQLALAWLTALLAPQGISQDATISSTLTAYELFVWPDNLKEVVVQMLVQHDEYIFWTFSNGVMSWSETHAAPEKAGSSLACPHKAMIQNIFELHLDIYSWITNSSSEFDVHTRTAQLDRLQRWASLAQQVCNISGDAESEEPVGDTSSIRLLWAYAVLAELGGTCSQDLVVMYFRDLKSTLERLGSPFVELPNNAVMSEVSTEAAEKQISRLTTMDFFINIFSPSNEDPITLIENLEPMLEKSMQADSCLTRHEEYSTTNHGWEIPEDNQDGATNRNTSNMQMEQMLQFLDKASLSMRLMLWRRLIDAYSIIQYTPRILLCYLRCISLIVNYLGSSRYSENNVEDRSKSLLRWFKSLDDLLAWTLALAWSDAHSLDCMDEANLRESLYTLTRLQEMLQPVMVVDDLVKIGLCEAPPQANHSASTAYNNSMARLRDMIVRTWTLRYILMCEGASQNSCTSPMIHRDQFQCLTSIHRCLGPRNYCKLADKIFLKLARRELSRIGNLPESEIEGAQIIFDMYGLKICPGSKDIEDHECPAESLYRSDAVEIMDRVMVQVNRLSIKDLIKSDLRLAVEKMQQAIRVPKNTATVLHNRRVINEYLRRPVNPRVIHRALLGIGELHFQQPHGESFRIAEKGWYFLQGHVALTKYRSQKRTNTAASDDLNIAMKFFEYDLEQGYEKWETWFRLAQVYDAKLEEDTTWTADKLDNHTEDLVKLQRSAIHCYTMATATFERCPNPVFEMFQTAADLYSDFGTRIYGSSREPFAMDALGVTDFPKYFNAGRSGNWQGDPFRAITIYGAWTLASSLFRRSLVHNAEKWMYVVKSKRLGETAIETFPERRDNKHPEKDPTLEPHYKLVSVVHKLVSSRRLPAEAGCQILTTTAYARRVPPVQDFDDWEGYILSVLKALRSADKSNWHHRMVLRSARTVYDESPNDHMAILAAKHELTQQIFTKTMTVQVWKPEHERTGRHFVYTTRYVHFFLRLLYELNDRVGIEALGRQIRKKPGKFFRHARLWHEACTTHLKLLRAHSALPEDLSDTVFKNISHEIFVQNADRLEIWAQHLPTSSLSSTSAPPIIPSSASQQITVVDTLREAIELKKTNANLMKPAAIEDFIADAYAHLHRTVVPDLIARSNEEETRGRMRLGHLMNLDEEGPPIAAIGGTSSPGPAAVKEDDTTAAAAASAPARQRVRGVGRRELQKRAEGLVNKATNSTTGTAAVAKAPTTTSNNNKKPSTPPPPQPPHTSGAVTLTPKSTIQVLVPIAGGGDGSSVPGSMHDSADDESELSDGGGPGFRGPNRVGEGDGEEEEEEEEDGGDDEGGGEEEEEEEEHGEGAEVEVEGEIEGEGEEVYHTPMEM
ncbi:MAG: hypothetical protein Q9185_001931 [Variospora sp. 1 TL-2023]